MLVTKGTRVDSHYGGALGPFCFGYVLVRVFPSVLAIRGKSGSSHGGLSAGEEVHSAKRFLLVLATKGTRVILHYGVVLGSFCFGYVSASFSISACEKGKSGSSHGGRSVGEELHSAKRFLLVLATKETKGDSHWGDILWKKVPSCEKGRWQWPYRGVLVSEASHPGPPWQVRPETERETNERRLGEVSEQQFQVPNRMWRALEAVNFETELRRPVRTVREPPRWFRGQFKKAMVYALHEWQRSRNAVNWKLFVLTPRMLLGPTEECGIVGKQVFNDRLRKYLKREWVELMGDCVLNDRVGNKSLDVEALERAQLKQAEAKIKLREVSKARAQLSSNGLAPGDVETLNELRNPLLRPLVPNEVIPPNLLNFRPTEKIQIDSTRLMDALRSAGRGSAQDLAGMRYEHLRVLMEDDEAWCIFAQLAQDFARAEVPEEIMQGLRLG